MNTTKTTTTRTSAGEVLSGEDLVAGVGGGEPARSGSRARRSERGRGLLGDEYIDALIAQADADGLALTGRDGFLTDLIGRVLERGLSVELADHLGDPLGRGAPNSRNGSTPKTLATEVGPVPIATPRDRAGSFEPRLVPEGARGLGGLDEQIIAPVRGRDDGAGHPGPPGTSYEVAEEPRMNASTRRGTGKFDPLDAKAIAAAGRALETT